jgi:hypothetical protein
MDRTRSSIRSPIRFVWLLAGCLVVAPFAVLAEEIPCQSRPMQEDDGEGELTLLLPTSTARARELIVDSLRAAGFQVQKEKKDKTLARRFNIELGGELTTKSGKTKAGMGGEQFWFRVEEAPDGARVVAETKKTVAVMKSRQGFFTTAVFDQARCLYDLLDKSVAPVSPAPGTATDVVVPDGTLVRLLLYRSLFSRTAEAEQEVRYLVAEDVVVDGVAVIRRGSSALGKVEVARKARGFGRGGQLDFTIDHVVAADGREVALREHADLATGEDDDANVSLAAPLFGSVFKGSEVGVRAGSEFLAYVDGDAPVGARAPE